jgi:outer membrane receptor protein involved in Fe transport
MLKLTGSILFGLVCASAPLRAQTNSDSLLASDLFSRTQLETTGELESSRALTLFRPDLFSSANGSLLIHGLPALTLLNGRRLLISEDSGRFGASPLETLPLAFLSAVRVDTTTSPLYGSDGPGGVIDLQTRQVSTGGEMGVYYGSSSGKFGGEDVGAYILGGVGTDKFQISAGASYEKSSGRGLLLSR